MKMTGSREIEGLENLIDMLEQGHVALMEASRETQSMSYLNPSEAILYSAHEDLGAIVRSVAHTKLMLKKLRKRGVVDSSLGRYSAQRPTG